MEDASLRTYIPSTKNVTISQMAQAEEHLNNQLDRIDIMFNQMRDLKSGYIAKQDEIIAWRIQLDEKIMIARNAITVWAQSHRNLGAGIPVPPMIDVAGMASGLAGSAAKTIIP
jgi:hypothetical protein